MFEKLWTIQFIWMLLIFVSFNCVSVLSFQGACLFPTKKNYKFIFSYGYFRDWLKSIGNNEIETKTRNRFDFTANKIEVFLFVDNNVYNVAIRIEQIVESKFLNETIAHMFPKHSIVGDKNVVIIVQIPNKMYDFNVACNKSENSHVCIWLWDRIDRIETTNNTHTHTPTGKNIVQTLFMIRMNL